MTETLTSTLAEVFASGVAGVTVTGNVKLGDLLKAVPEDWGVYDCSRLATAAEMAESRGYCSDCDERVGDKYGALSSVTGTVLGYRFGADQLWVWSGVLCRRCEILASIADGYGTE